VIYEIFWLIFSCLALFHGIPPLLRPPRTPSDQLILFAMPSIAGQSILIIGGSSGIGAAVATLAAAEGLRVSIASSNPTRVASAVAKLKAASPNAQIAGYTCDLSHDDIESRLEKLFTDVTTATGNRLDHIIFTAGIVNMKPVSEVTVDYLRNAGQLAFTAPLLIAKLAPRFLERGYKSSLIFTSGRLGEKPLAGYTMGSTFAAAVFGMARNLALDLAPRRVNVVSPGATNTELWGSEEVRAKHREVIDKTALLSKVGSPEEVGEAYIYLMKDTNATGSIVSTSGGSLIQ
jgi:NAD(P)-dependent dehydrogenase (short-subunit alcohol dehydrogenase family)